MDRRQQTAPPQDPTDWEEVARRGRELYERHLRAQLEPAHQDQFVVIDVDTGDYFLGATSQEAFEAAERQRPGGKFYLARVGHAAAIRIRRRR